MKVLVLGASGMLGHRVYAELKSRGYQTRAVVRRSVDELSKFGFFHPTDLIPGIDLTRSNLLLPVLLRETPDVIVNCAGVTTRKLGFISKADIIGINSHLPHLLDEWSRLRNTRFVHISTDCVFEGKNAPYSEDSRIEAQDIYGMSKALGEIKNSKNSITLRTSIIGPELEGKTELFEWFLAQKGKTVQGYSQVIYSGVTTNVLAKVIGDLIAKNPMPVGLLQISSEPISKFDLLELIRDCFDLNIKIEAESRSRSDKTLSHQRMLREIGSVIPSWKTQIQDLKTSMVSKEEGANRL